MMDIRNATYNRFGTIDCEIEHPQFGWIPFTASPADPEEHGRAIYAEAIKGDVAPYVEPPAPPPQVPETISDRQFFQALAIEGIITQAEALAAVKTGDVPSGMLPLIAELPEANQFAAEMLLSGATEFKRSNSLTVAFGAAYGWTDGRIDAFWIAASQL